MMTSESGAAEVMMMRHPASQPSFSVLPMQMLMMEALSEKSSGNPLRK
jgi:hypothetical protein